MEISIILPAYKEADNLKMILPQIHGCLSSIKHEILVIDTMSPMDETKDICVNNSATYVNRENGNTYGDAIRTGISKANGKYIVVMDADGSHNPNNIVDFYEIMKNGSCDLVIGSRYCKGGYTDNNFILRLMSWILNFVYRIIFGLKVKDVSDSFRMYKSEQVKNISLEFSNFDIVEELLVKLNLVYNPYIIIEFPISFNKRLYGKSKRKLGKFIMSYLVAIKELIKVKREYERQ